MTARPKLTVTTVKEGHVSVSTDHVSGPQITFCPRGRDPGNLKQFINLTLQPYTPSTAMSDCRQCEDQVLATSNTKLNSNPSCRVSLLHQSADEVSDCDCASPRTTSRVRFNEEPEEFPEAAYFDCSKIRKVDKMLSRRKVAKMSGEKSQVLNVCDSSESDTELADDDGTSASPSPNDETRQRKSPLRGSTVKGSPLPIAADLSG